MTYIEPQFHHVQTTWQNTEYCHSHSCQTSILCEGITPRWCLSVYYIAGFRSIWLSVSVFTYTALHVCTMLPLLHSVSKIGNKADTERVFSYRRLCIPSIELHQICIKNGKDEDDMVMTIMTIWIKIITIKSNETYMFVVARKLTKWSRFL